MKIKLNKEIYEIIGGIHYTLRDHKKDHVEYEVYLPSMVKQRKTSCSKKTMPDRLLTYFTCHVNVSNNVSLIFARKVIGNKHYVIYKNAGSIRWRDYNIEFDSAKDIRKDYYEACAYFWNYIP